jgi:predicted  nucleic acid-binding Zn-ribbon protein
MDKHSLYDQDFYSWTQQQAKALAQQLVEELDWQHLQEEIQALGRQEYRELVSRLSVLLGHLLKWEYQPEQRSRSWFLTIREQRRAIHRHLRQNLSLKSRIEEALLDGFEAGVDLALRETNLRLRTFPENCPYLFNDIISDTFLCDTSQDWEG